MYNPKFELFHKTVLSLVNTHKDDIASLKTKWVELKDEDGEVYQIVPLYDITFKG